MVFEAALYLIEFPRYSRMGMVHVPDYVSL